MLGLDVAALDTRFPVQEVSTGLPFVVVPLQNLAALKQVKVDRDRCLTLLADAQAKALLVFSPETYQRRNDLSVRVFADYYGVPEDPATGSANGCLAAYLTRLPLFQCGPHRHSCRAGPRRWPPFPALPEGER